MRSALVCSVADVAAEHDDLPCRRRDEVEDLQQRGGLAAAGLADEAERLALADVEVDPVDGVDGADPALEHRALHQREVPSQSVEAQHLRRSLAGQPRRAAARRSRAAGRCRRRPRLPAAISPLRMHAAQVPGRGRLERAPARPSRQASMTIGQRGANGQPGGRLTSDGGLPSIGTSADFSASSRRGTAPSRPIV